MTTNNHHAFNEPLTLPHDAAADAYIKRLLEGVLLTPTPEQADLTRCAPSTEHA